jgi:hypothetical protein
LRVTSARASHRSQTGDPTPHPEVIVARYRRAIHNVALELLERDFLNPLQIATVIRKSR